MNCTITVEKEDQWDGISDGDEEAVEREDQQDGISEGDEEDSVSFY